MIHKMFTIYDSAADMFFKPWYAKATGEAVRDFADNINRHDSPMHRHAADYTLFEIGTYDDSTGFCHMLDAHINLGNAEVFKVQRTAARCEPELPLAKEKN